MISQIVIIGEYTERYKSIDNIIKRWDNTKFLYKNDNRNIKISSNIALDG